MWVLPIRFTIRSLVGAGGAGRVYRVTDQTRDRELALKLVSASDVEFLRREFDTLRQIRHENMVQVFDWGTLPSGEAYYTMELVEGEDWGARAGGGQPAGDVQQILTGVLRGLAHLHSHGEIHGDLKPGNVLLGGGGVVKLTDVGMGGSTRGSGMAGTPGYAAPECWEGKTPDIRSDLYSVGVMAYEALTGKHPFSGRTIREVVAGQMEGWVPSPAAHGVRIPADLERAVMRALERDPQLRQGSADEFMEAIGVENRIGTILGGRFVGRDGLLGTMMEGVSRQRSGDPTLVVLSGAPGVGKSEALVQLETALSDRGIRCIHVDPARGAPLETVLRSEFSGTGAASEGRRALLDRIVEASRTTQLALLVDASASQAARERLVARELAQEIWARSQEEQKILPVAVVITAPEPESAEVFARQIHLEPLDEAATIELARGLLGTLDVAAGGAEALHAATGGIPSAIHAVLFDAMASDSLQRIAGRWRLHDVGHAVDSASPTLANMWRRRWDRVGPGQRKLLGLTSLYRAPLDAADAERLESLAGAPGGIAALRASGWLALEGARTRLASEALRDVILQALGRDSCAALSKKLLDADGLQVPDEHRRYLRLLAAPGERDLEFALAAAAAASARGDSLGAVRWLDEVLPHQELLRDQERRAILHIQMAEVRVACGEFEAARQSLDHDSVRQARASSASVDAKVNHLRGLMHLRTANLADARREILAAADSAARAGDVSVHLKCLALIGELVWTHGDEAERKAALPLAEKVLKEISSTDAPSEERLQAVYSVGAALVRAFEIDQAIALLERESSRGLSGYWGARILNALAIAYRYHDRHEDGLATLDRALEILEREEAPDVRGRILANRGAKLNTMGRLRESLDSNERALTWSRRSGSSFDVIAAVAGIAINLYYLGRFEDAVARARECRELAGLIDNWQYVYKGLELEGFALEAIGGLEDLRRVMAEVDALGVEHDPLREMPRLEWLRAKLRIREGDRAGARASLSKARQILERSKDLEDLWGVEIELAALDHAEAGLDATLAALTAIAGRAREAKVLVVEIQAAVAIAEILFHERKTDPELIRLLTTILGRAEEAGFVADAWKINMGLGVVLFEAGETRAGHTRLVQAQRLLVQIANGLSEDSRRIFVRSPHVAPALEEIGRRLSPVSK